VTAGSVGTHPRDGTTVHFSKNCFFACRIYLPFAAGLIARSSGKTGDSTHLWRGVNLSFEVFEKFFQRPTNNFFAVGKTDTKSTKHPGAMEGFPAKRNSQICTDEFAYVPSFDGTLLSLAPLVGAVKRRCAFNFKV